MFAFISPENRRHWLRRSDTLCIIGEWPPEPSEVRLARSARDRTWRIMEARSADASEVNRVVGGLDAAYSRACQREVEAVWRALSATKQQALAAAHGADPRWQIEHTFCRWNGGE